jgi:hypothetical protein
MTADEACLAAYKVNLQKRVSANLMLAKISPYQRQKIWTGMRM